MKYRNHYEIIAKILQTSIEPVTKTRIMYNSYLSYTQLKEYLNKVIENQLLILTPDQNYVITPKGRQFLDQYNRIQLLLSESNFKEITV